MDASANQELGTSSQLDSSGFAGHPRGLTTLFFTELWERFSYYGMRAILVLYMVARIAQGGLAFDTKHAASIYGTYTMSVYLTALPGGLVADHWLGLAVLLGGIVIACGHFSIFPYTGRVWSTVYWFSGVIVISKVALVFDGILDGPDAWKICLTDHHALNIVTPSIESDLG